MEDVAEEVVFDVVFDDVVVVVEDVDVVVPGAVTRTLSIFTSTSPGSVVLTFLKLLLTVIFFSEETYVLPCPSTQALTASFSASSK